MPLQRFSVRVHFHFRFLPGLHVFQLRLFEVGRHPYVLQRHHDEQALSRLHDLSRLHLFVRGYSIDRRGDFRVTQVQLRRSHCRARLFHLRDFRLRIGGLHVYLLDVGMRRGHSCARLLDSRLRRIQLRFGHIHVALRLREFFLIRFQRARGGIRIGLRRVVLLLRNFALLH